MCGDEEWSGLRKSAGTQMIRQLEAELTSGGPHTLKLTYRPREAGSQHFLLRGLGTQVLHLHASFPLREF